MDILQKIDACFSPIELKDEQQAVKMINSIYKRLMKNQTIIVTDKMNSAITANPNLLKISLLKFTHVVRDPNSVETLQYSATAIFFTNCLELMRISVESGHPYVSKYLKEFGDILLKLIPLCTNEFSASLLEVLKEANYKIPDPIKTALNEKLREYAETNFSDIDIQNEFEELIASHENSFTLYEEILANFATFESNALVDFTYALLAQPDQIAKDAAILFLLHNERAVRIGVAEALNQTPINCFSGDGLRWMIVLRNWLPENERGMVDKIIKKIRKGGVLITPMQPKKKIKAYTTYIDGAGVNSTIAFIEEKNFYGVFSILVKQGYGVKDVWFDEYDSVKELTAAKKRILSNDVIIGKVKLEYLDVILPFFIAESNSLGKVPSPNLLMIADTLGKTSWIANQSALDTDTAEVDHLKAEVELDWAKYDFWNTWYLDSEETEAIKQDKKIKKEEKLKRILNILDSKERIIWDNKLKIMAEISKFGEDLDLPLASEFLHVSTQINSGKPVEEIQVFSDIARNSLI